VPPVSFVATAALELNGVTSPAWVVEKLVNGMGGIRSAILSCLDGCGRDEQRLLKRCSELMQRAELCGGAKPRSARRKNMTPEMVQQQKDADFLKHQRALFHGLKKGTFFESVDKLLRTKWKDWACVNSWKDKQAIVAKQIVDRAVLRGGHLPRSFLHPKTASEVQEHKDAVFIQKARLCLRRGLSADRKLWSATIGTFDTQWKDEWKLDKYTELEATKTCSEVVDRANRERNGALPRVKKNGLAQESRDAKWVQVQKMLYHGIISGIAYQSVFERLTKQWGDAWRATRKDKAIKFCMEVCDRADVRGGQMPTCSNKLRNGSPDERQEYVDGCWIRGQRQTFKNKDDAAYHVEVFERLFAKWPDWNSTSRGRPRMRREENDQKRPKTIVEEDSDAAGAGSGRARLAGPLTAWHQKWKSRTAASFVEAIQAAPEEWHKYHAVAAQQDARDPPETSVFTVLSQWLGKLAASQAGAASGAASGSHAASAVPPLRVVDLGCGTNGLKRACNELRLDWTCVDAVGADDTVTVGNLGALPDGGAWTGRFSAAVLSRALWATDKATVLAEVYRVLHHGAFLFAVEPVSKYRDAATGANTLPGLLTAAGFEVDLANSWGGGAGTGHTTSVYQFLLCKKPALAFL
jgi:hypothetical protein